MADYRSAAPKWKKQLLLKGSYYPKQLQATNQSIYRVDKILKRRTVRGKAQVLVKWAGYADKFNSWEPADAILHSQL